MIPDYYVVSAGGGLDFERRSTDSSNIVIASDTIVEIGPPGIDAPRRGYAGGATACMTTM